ncbi:DUF2062 domain-containing protein [Humisphaera borealis]|uniref:DUF2062 domain-containing protein n=1 Tax=Humisphaera borealis TaxID=2807512 RepID=A0A7M2X1I5_9BACT|nr:DUF2062 domain-containing protein [Humisphaera borealis]QOV91469.1 DUF2062 domain-containing protein [Humisphaera borealis]
MEFKPVVIAPTYNNAGTLLDVLRRVDAQGVAVIAVNDGSTDSTAAILEQWLDHPGNLPRHIETHEKNRGKAAALRTGFELAKKLGFTHALSIDTDGQLSPEQIPQMFELARANPESLVLGVRDASAADYPWRSRLGRRSANLLIYMESGLRVADSQCGLRVYPLAMPELLKCRAGRYGFETEIIVRAGWAGRSIAEMPALCTYFAGERRVSHFRPWVDSMRAAFMHARLVGRRLLPFGGIRDRVAEAESDAAAPAAPTPHWRRVLNWLSPRDAWRQIRQDRPEGFKRTAAAGGLAIGAFIGCLPLYGLHAILALYGAKRLHLNPLAMVLGTQVACPPVGIVLAMLAVGLGHIVRFGHIPPPQDFAPMWDGWAGFMKLGSWFFIDWAIGSVVVGIGTMFVVFFVADALLRRIPVSEAAPALDTPAPVEVRPTAAS